MILVLLLLQALLALVVLTYVHFAFNRDPVNCLVDISDSWSRDGVLRVEVLLNSSLVSNYTLADSYNKEFVLYGSDIEHSQSELSSTEVSNTTGDDLLFSFVLFYIIVFVMGIWRVGEF